MVMSRPQFGTRLQYELWRYYDNADAARRGANYLEHETGQLTRVRKVAGKRKWGVYATIARRISPLYGRK